MKITVFFLAVLCEGLLMIFQAHASVTQAHAGKESKARNDSAAISESSVDDRKIMELAREIEVAKVNRTGIPMDSFLRAMERIIPKFRDAGEDPTPEVLDKIKSQALDWVIFEELAVQEAVRQQIKPSGESEELMADVKGMFDSDEAFQEYLEKIGLTEDAYRKQIQRLQLYESITQKEIYEKAKVEEKEVREAYKRDKARFVVPEEIIVDDVFFTMKGEESAVLERAKQVLATVSKREDKDVWTQVPDGTFVVRKLIVEKEKNPEIYQAVSTMSPGELSAVIGDQDGFHFVKVVQKKRSRQQAFEDVKEMLERRLTVSAQEKRKQDWEGTLREKAEIGISLKEAEKRLKEMAAAGK